MAQGGGGGTGSSRLVAKFFCTYRIWFHPPRGCNLGVYHRLYCHQCRWCCCHSEIGLAYRKWRAWWLKERKKAVFNRSLKRFATVVFLQLVRVQPSATILSLPPYRPMWGNPGQSWILDSTLWIPDYNYWIPVFVSRTWLLDSGFQLIVGFRIPKPRSPDSTSKIFRVPDSTSKFSHILDSTSKNFPDSAIHYMWRAAIGSLIL